MPRRDLNALAFAGLRTGDGLHHSLHQHFAIQPS
jgi:hypothetical protein